MVGESAEAQIDVRPAGARDLDALVALSLAVARTEVTWAGRDWVPPDAVTARQLWWERIRDLRTWAAVAVAGFTRVGGAAAWPAPHPSDRPPKLAYLVGPLVDPEWWGEGIGTALLDRTLAVLTRQDFVRVEVAMQEGNGHGRRFLEHRGWEQAGQPERRSPMAIVLYGRMLVGEPIENHSQYAA